jgi:hypothetical protein
VFSFKIEGEKMPQVETPMPQLDLSPEERAEIKACLEENRPIPSEYRFKLFEEPKRMELVWKGKTAEICNAVLPFQTVEQVDEPRSSELADTQLSLFEDMTTNSIGRQQDGWSNKLIWGDNRLILSSLANGALRKQIEAHGGLKLVYIDPPFDVGADFTTKVEIGGKKDSNDTLEKNPSVIEEIAYRDTWGEGSNSYASMIYERLKLIHSLLAEDGSIYVHCDYRVSGIIRFCLDEIFGKDNLMNEIVWWRLLTK